MDDRRVGQGVLLRTRHELSNLNCVDSTKLDEAARCDATAQGRHYPNVTGVSPNQWKREMWPSRCVIPGRAHQVGKYFT